MATRFLGTLQGKPSFAEKVNVGLGRGFQMGNQLIQERQQGEAYDKLGIPRGTPKELAQTFLSETMRGQRERDKASLKGQQEKPLTPLQQIQLQKLENEMNQEKDENSYLNRLMGGGQEEQTEEIPYEGEPEEEKPTQAKVKFDPEDPTTWTDKQINQFRSLEGKTSKAKTLSNRAKNEYERRQESKKISKKYKEDIAPFQGAIETLDQMEKIGSRKRLGIGTKARGIISPQTRKDAAEYERLGKSLISFASNIPIRNRQEFETLAHDLYDPSISDDSRAGILSAMRRIIENSMKGFEAPDGEETYIPIGNYSTPRTNAPERPPLTTFMR